MQPPSQNISITTQPQWLNPAHGVHSPKLAIFSTLRTATNLSAGISHHTDLDTTTHPKPKEPAFRKVSIHKHTCYRMNHS